MKNKFSIAIVEDDLTQREILAEILIAADYEVSSFENAEEALQNFQNNTFDLVLTDLRMPNIDGLELLQKIKQISPTTEVVVMTAYATIQTAVKAVKQGAYDYLAKPFDKDELLMVIERALEKHSLQQENTRLKQLLTETDTPHKIIGNCPAMQQVFDVIHRAIPIKTTVLIMGESGTGKELVARYIHFNGPRKDKPFIVVNCAAIPETLIESELFGHEKGAFTGAETSRPGKFELAHSGTIFLDEIGDMRIESQAKLLRVLQDETIERIGSSQSKKVDVRVIAATNRPLRKLVEEGKFRQDLYFRLEILPINLPPLRERLDDLPLLVSYLSNKIAAKLHRPVPSFHPKVFDVFRKYPWPGNIRELENLIEQLIILSDKKTIDVTDLPERFHEHHFSSNEFVLPPHGVILEELEQKLIRQALARTGGKIIDAAKLLGISYKTLQYRIKKYNIESEDN